MIKHFIIGLFIIHYSLFTIAQETISSNTEQQLENITDMDQSETEDDSFWQQLQQFLKNPVNINTATADELKELKVISDLQIDNLIRYRRLFGPLLSVYELQAVPLWDAVTIKKILPFITIANVLTVHEDFKKRFNGGEHSFLVRVSQVLEKSLGYDKSSTGTKYLGSPLRLFSRYRYSYGNTLQYGIAADKDAGEEFFKGSQKQGFDFYTFHFFVRNIGKFKAIAIGDYSLNMGQGLIQWQNLALRKGADILNIKRQSPVIRPYNSAGEFLFNRGAAATFQSGKIEATAFISYRKLSANFVADTVNHEDFISSFLNSGYHRTESEIADKNKVGQFAVGGNIKYRSSNWHIGFNGIHYRFSLPIQKRTEPYNLYAIGGKTWTNFSIDYSYTYRNIHFFGEAASTQDFKTAFINGLMVSVDPRVDISILHRNISEQYQAINGNAFTENTYPTNENGLFTGIAIKPSYNWRIDAYMDLFKFPWLKYLVDAPSSGSDFLVQLSYLPNKQTEIFTRFRNETKETNQPDNISVTNYLVKIPKQSWRTQIRYRINPTFTLKNRIELLWFDNKGNNSERGFLTFFDVLYKPLLKPFAGNIRLQYFETDDYDSRLYAYENDILYSYSIPVFYDKGFRYYLNLSYNLGRRTTFWLRWAQSIYDGKTSIGSGLDEIPGNQKSEFKAQVIIIL
ncbi:MAG: helix-hairpin-helix domain-containing protein [Bacteroidetes bacterium]|nr:MAG: helix-hairpin-helix domain-containing protein [Bacteroidota bacterium]